jgi:hypothetical protein
MTVFEKLFNTAGLLINGSKMLLMVLHIARGIRAYFEEGKTYRTPDELVDFVTGKIDPDLLSRYNAGKFGYVSKAIQKTAEAMHLLHLGKEGR